VNPQGAQKIADILLHDVVPVMYLGYWLEFYSQRFIALEGALFWLPYPLALFLLVLDRGAAVGWYPYPFIDASKLRYSPVLAKRRCLLAQSIGDTIRDPAAGSSNKFVCNFLVGFGTAML